MHCVSRRFKAKSTAQARFAPGKEHPLEKKKWKPRIQEKETTTAMQKKTLVGKRQTAKKARVTKQVSKDVQKAEQIKAPSRTGYPPDPCAG